MDIITISAIVVLTITLFAVFLFKFYVKKKQSKLNILTIKKYGGVVLTKKEHKFLANNKRMKFNAWQQKPKRKPITREGTKAAILSFFDKLNPFRYYKEKIEELEKVLSRTRGTLSYLSADISNMSAEIEKLQPKKEKESAAVIIKREQAKAKNGNKSMLDNLGKTSYSSFA